LKVVFMAATATYPVHVDATLDPHLSRWLWLVKWILVIPHYVVLFFLWLAFAVLTVVAFFAIVFTGRYPRSIFEFNLGVLRWTWRVDYYAYGALGTDRYPPFTLADVADYPARLDIEYPERLSRGLVLVKWWLLAIPHYLITGIFVGGGAWLAWQSDDWQWSWGGGGLVGVLVLISAVILAVTGSYPRPLFDFILGMNRWVLRVAGYAGLMTDRYPPFRLDLGGHEPAGSLTFAGPAATPGVTGQPVTDDVPPVGATGAPGAPDEQYRGGASSAWTPGRTASVIAGGVLALFAVGLTIGGAAILWADRANRDSTGYLTSASTTFSTAGRALTSDSMSIDGGGPGWAYPRSVLGDVRFRFTADDPSRETFVGIAPTSAVRDYLSGVEYSTVTDFGSGGATYTRHTGGAPASPPADAEFWVARANGSGTQSLTWTPSSGDWTILVMNADGSAGISVRADAGANVPALTWVAIGVLAGGLLLLAASSVLIIVPVTRATSPKTA
jgi:hypothetical protein